MASKKRQSRHVEPKYTCLDNQEPGMLVSCSVTADKPRLLPRETKRLPDLEHVADRWVHVTPPRERLFWAQLDADATAAVLPQQNTSVHRMRRNKEERRRG